MYNMEEIRVYKRLDGDNFVITDVMINAKSQSVNRVPIKENERKIISSKQYLKDIQDFKKDLKMDSKSMMPTRSQLGSETSAIGYEKGSPYAVKVTKSGSQSSQPKGTIKLTVNNTTTAAQTIIVGDCYNTIASKVYNTVLPAGVIIGGTFGNLTLFTLKTFTQSIAIEFDKVHIQSPTPNFFGDFTYRHAMGNIFNLPPVEFDVDLSTDITNDSFRTDVRRRGYNEPYSFVLNNISAILMSVPAGGICTITFTVPRAGTSVLLNEVNQVNC